MAEVASKPKKTISISKALSSISYLLTDWRKNITKFDIVKEDILQRFENTYPTVQHQFFQLDELHLRYFSMPDKVFLGPLNKDKNFKVKHDVTDDFFASIIDMCNNAAGNEVRIQQAKTGKKYLITCVEI